MVETAPGGGYRLADATPFMFAGQAVERDALDENLSALGWTKPVTDQPSNCAANLSNTVS